MSDNIETAAAQKIRQRLMNKAVHYLGRYASTKAKLADVLKRFATRKLGHFPPDELAPHITYTVNRCAELGYVDDTAFAKAKWQAGLRSGKAPQMLAQKLKIAGVDETVIKDLIEAESHIADSELQAAIISARKRRIGPFARVRPTEFSEKQKHMARLVRAGFSLSVAKQVISFETEEEAENYQS